MESLQFHGSSELGSFQARPGGSFVRDRYPGRYQTNGPRAQGLGGNGTGAMDEESLFLTALDKPTGSERQAFLEDACAGDLALRLRVERLLSANDKTIGILDGPAGNEGGLFHLDRARDRFEVRRGCWFLGLQQAGQGQAVLRVAVRTATSRS